MEKSELMQKNWFFTDKRILVVALLLVFVAALGIRLYDLDDLPLDFHPTRQLFSMFKARGLYYAMNPGLPEWQREIAAVQFSQSAVIEPPVLESIVALSYSIIGREELALPRVFSSLFWLAGGWFVFLLARRITNDDAAFVSLLLFLFLPYGVYASRSFQPDPLMTALLAASTWALWRWQEEATEKWALTTGLLLGAAIFVKNVMVFPLAFSALGLVLARGLKVSLKDRQTWLVAALAVLPVALFTLYGLFVADFLGGQFGLRFFPNLWGELAFYLRWKGQWEYVIGFGTVVMAAIGLLLLRGRAFALLAGLWLGYFIYGMTFAYHIITHDYYHLPFIPLVALGLAPAAQALFRAAENLSHEKLLRPALGILLALIIALNLWTVRVELARQDFRGDAAYWEGIGKVLGPSPVPVAIIAQDYGGRLAYWGWQPVQSWYTDGDLAIRELAGIEVDQSTSFEDLLADKRFFVAAQLERFDQQTEIKEYLYHNYPVFAEGRGYIIFDLQGSK